MMVVVVHVMLAGSRPSSRTSNVASLPRESAPHTKASSSRERSTTGGTSIARFLYFTGHR